MYKEKRLNMCVRYFYGKKNDDIFLQCSSDKGIKGQNEHANLGIEGH